MKKRDLASTLISDATAVRTDLCSFFASHRALALVTALSLVASYGFAITSFSLSIDEEIHLVKDMIPAWIAQDRFGIALLKVAFRDTLPLPFFDVFVSCATLGLSAMTWCFVFVRSSEGSLARSPALFVFALFFSTLPANAYYLTFNTYNIEVSFGHLFAAVAVASLYLYIIEKRSVVFLLLAGLLFAACISIYQSFIFVLFAGSIAVMLVASSVAINRDMIVWFILVACVLIVLGFALDTGIARVLRQQQPEYINAFFNWGKLDWRFIVDWISRSILATLRGDGFIGGISVPIALAGGIAGTLGLVAKGRQYWPILVLVIGLSIAPFLLSIALGTAMPLRSQQTLPLAFGTFFLIFSLGFPKWRLAGPILIATGIAIFFWNGQANTRLFLSDYLTYRRDVNIARSGGSGLSLRSDDFDSVVELYTKDDFRQLVVTAETIPTFLGGLCELEDHGQRGLVREAASRSDRSMPNGCERALDRVCRA